MQDKQKNYSGQQAEAPKGQKHADPLKEDLIESKNALGQLKEATIESVQALGDKAADLTQEARGRINEQVGSAGEVIRTTLEDTAQALNNIGDSDSPLIVSLKPYISRVGTLMDDTSNYLNTVTPQRLIQDTRTLARKNPGIFVGGALALGLIASRFLKSTSDSYKDS